MTSPDVLSYLLDETEGDKMPGTIRTKQSCPVCSKPFIHLQKVGIICPQHRTIPTKYFVDLSYKGQRLKIYSSRKGETLDSYSKTNETLEHIRYEVRNHTFDPSKYVKSEMRGYLFSHQTHLFIREKEDEEIKGSIAPTYIGNLKNYFNQYFLPYFADMDVREIKTQTIREFYMQLPKRAEKTYKNIMDALRHFFNVLLNYELIEKIPKFPIIRVPEHMPSWTLESNQLRFLDAIPKEDRPIFVAIFFQGARPSEIRALKWKDFDFEHGAVYIRRIWSGSKLCERTKSRNIKPRMIHPYLMETLTSMGKRIPETFVFFNPRTGKHYDRHTLTEIFSKARKMVGII
ncbi:MAG: tyrosine-type recombinase/integrase [Nitrospirae bacterium]|nr:tyrosine-type recombinase/integrase [Nitrospirota bacterium]